MSLVKQRHITLAAAAVLAVWAPLRLADPQTETPPTADVERVRNPRVMLPPALQASLAKAPFLDPGNLQYGGEPGATGGAPSGEAPPPPLPPPPQLVGTAVGPRGKAVALVRGGNGTVETLARGEAIDGWTLARIARGEARFVQRGEVHVATLAMPNTPGAPALARSSQDLPQ